MDLMVTIKETAELEDDFEFDGNQLDDRFVEYQLNEWDEYALEEAVQLKENNDEIDEVVSVTVGPPRCEETIRMALAKGADRAVRVWDDALGGRELPDPRVTAQLLAPVAREISPEIIMSGVMANDDLISATGLTLAQLLDYEWGAVVNQFELDIGENIAQIHRELEGGLDELATVQLPAVFTIQTGINEPRYASLRGIRQARDKELTVKSLDDLELSKDLLDTPLQVQELREPKTDKDTQYFEGSLDEQCQQLAGTLDELGVVNR